MGTFKPSDETRAILRELHCNLAEEADKKFFDIWESEIADPMAPRMAGSVIANAYMRLAARFAVFGCECVGREPNRDLWLELAKQQFDDAIVDCAESTLKKTLAATPESPQGTTAPEADHG